MASQRPQLNQNPSGHFFVDDRCIGCTLCTLLAPSFFSEDLSQDTAVDTAYIRRQPITTAETALCREAVLNCPTNAIGEKGPGK